MELFDAILKRGRYSEADARPVVAQIASALAYLHAQHIVHRDIKPENIRVTPAKDGASPRIKLLDFGLSKVVDVDSGSAARTFVGTPVYLAPEVEKREGATYGVEVDCWSLGAVLYVMLVARFPEFDVSPCVLGDVRARAHASEYSSYDLLTTSSYSHPTCLQRSSGVPRVKLEGPLWANTSVEAKELIRYLMNPDPGQRLTAAQVLRSPWTTLGEFRAQAGATAAAEETDEVAGGAATDGAVAPSMTAASGARTGAAKAAAEAVASTADGTAVRGQSPQLRSEGGSFASSPSSEMAGLDSFRGSNASVADLDAAGNGIISVPRKRNPDLAVPPAPHTTNVLVNSAAAQFPLLSLHRQVGELFKAALKTFEDSAIAAKLRSCALLGRAQLTDTLKMLKKLDHLAQQVSMGVEDLMLAIEVEEPKLAHKFLDQQKQWVTNLRREMTDVQAKNTSMVSELNTLIGELSVETARISNRMAEEAGGGEPGQSQGQHLSSSTQQAYLDPHDESGATSHSSSAASSVAPLPVRTSAKSSAGVEAAVTDGAAAAVAGAGVRGGETVSPSGKPKASAMGNSFVGIEDDLMKKLQKHSDEHAAPLTEDDCLR